MHIDTKRRAHKLTSSPQARAETNEEERKLVTAGTPATVESPVTAWTLTIRVEMPATAETPDKKGRQ
jgi:hypothetical protein